MNCCICHKPIKKKEGSFYVPYQVKPLVYRKKRWCRSCDSNRPEEVEEMLKKLLPDE